MEYSHRFNRDYDWYVKYKDIFIFDGTLQYTDKNNNSIFINSLVGLTAKECFYVYDSTGRISPCREIELYKQLHKCKGSINFNIKMWAEDRANGYLGKLEFMEDIIPKYELLDWMIVAVEKQKFYYGIYIKINL